jgi:hypothetical protein
MCLKGLMQITTHLITLKQKMKLMRIKNFPRTLTSSMALEASNHRFQIRSIKKPTLQMRFHLLN